MENFFGPLIVQVLHNLLCHAHCAKYISIDWTAGFFQNLVRKAYSVLVVYTGTV